MQILDNLIILVLIVVSFILGLKLDAYYRDKADAERKEALEKQFIRLRAKADADDPVKPYGTPQVSAPIHVTYQTGDFDGDFPLNQEFMTRLKENGQASAKFRKSDLSK